MADSSFSFREWASTAAWRISRSSPVAAGDQADEAGGGAAVDKVQPVPGAADVVVGTGVQQQAGVRLAQRLVHGAHGAVTKGALDVADAVNIAFIEHAQVQLLHRLEEERVERPALKPVPQRLKLCPVRLSNRSSKMLFRRINPFASSVVLKYFLS